MSEISHFFRIEGKNKLLWVSWEYMGRDKKVYNSWNGWNRNKGLPYLASIRLMFDRSRFKVLLRDEAVVDVEWPISMIA